MSFLKEKKPSTQPIDECAVSSRRDDEGSCSQAISPAPAPLYDGGSCSQAIFYHLNLWVCTRINYLVDSLKDNPLYNLSVLLSLCDMTRAYRRQPRLNCWTCPYKMAHYGPPATLMLVYSLGTICRSRLAPVTHQVLASSLIFPIIISVLEFWHYKILELCSF